MGTKWSSSVLCLALFLPVAEKVPAQDGALVVDPSKSSVSFTLSDVLHTVHGSFAVERGAIAFSRSTGTMTGQIEVGAASGHSGNRVRDERMAKEELHAKEFPLVTFTPTQFHGTIPSSGEGTVEVQGLFTLLGRPHPVHLPMRLDVSGTDCHAEGTLMVPYVAWGLHDPSTFVLRVAKDVQIQIKLNGTLHAH